MDILKVNLYNYNKKKGYIPLDNKGQPLFKNKKDYKDCINATLSLWGLENISKRCSIEHYVYTNPNDPLNQYGLGSRNRKDIKYSKNTNKVKWTQSNYIFISINDESKLTWQNVFRTLKVKKIHKPMFINHYNLYKNSPKYIKSKLLAIPVSNYLDVEFIKSKLTNIFKNNVQIISEFTYPFDFSMAITNAFTNELLTLHQVMDNIQNHRALDIMHILKEYESSKSIFYRNTQCYKNKNDEEWIYVNDDVNWNVDWADPNFVKWYNDKSDNDPKLIEERNEVSNFSFRYKKSWIINDYSEFKEKLYIIIPNLLNSSNIDKSKCISYSREQCWLIIKTHLVGYGSNHDKSYWDLTIGQRERVDAILNKYNYIYEWCFNNQKNLSLKQLRHISNIDRLSNHESMMIDMFITEKVFQEINPYKTENKSKQFKLFLSTFIKEVYGKIKFEQEIHNKDYNHNKHIKFNPILDKHVKQLHISNKEFNLIVDELKANNKGFNITPSSNLKYKILKSMGLEINNEYDFELYGKTVIINKDNSNVDYLKNILYKLVDKLSYNLSNNFIIIYVKKFLGLISDDTFKSVFVWLNDRKLHPPNIALT